MKTKLNNLSKELKISLVSILI